MKENGHVATQTFHKAKRTPSRNKPRANMPKEYWGIDIAKFLIPRIGWTYLMIVLDWYTKKIVGWNVSLRSRACEWLDALEMGINSEFPDGVRGKGLRLTSDNGTQPTAISFMSEIPKKAGKELATLEIEQIFTSYDNPKGNADTERMMKTIKEEVVWLNEFESIEEAKEKIGNWIAEGYNKFYVHSALGYLSPEEFEESYYHGTIKEKDRQSLPLRERIFVLT